jgi:hypothetical protein
VTKENIMRETAKETAKRLAATQKQPAKQSPDANQRSLARILRGNENKKPR